MSEQPEQPRLQKSIAQLTAEYQAAAKDSEAALQVIRELEPANTAARDKLRAANRAESRAENALLTALRGADA